MAYNILLQLYFCEIEESYLIITSDNRFHYSFQFNTGNDKVHPVNGTSFYTSLHKVPLKLIGFINMGWNFSLFDTTEERQ